MIDVDGIRQILKTSGLYGKEMSKNFIVKCPYCGDKTDKFGSHKHYHGYLSKDDNVSCYHCFYCNHSTSISRFLFDVTGDRHEDLIVPVNNKNYVKRTKQVRKSFKLPNLNVLDFPLKSLYMRRRTFNSLDLNDIPNLIFDIREFFRINDLDPNDYLHPFEQQHVFDNMVGFLSHRNTILYCRCVSNEVKIKFKKIDLQRNGDSVGLDYYCIDNGNPNSNKIVIAEGNFDVLGCYTMNTLNLKDDVRTFCAGCTFSYEELLKSVCMDFGIYKADVVLLSDADKNKYHYKRFLENSKPLINKIEIYYNSCGKDFGDYPHKPVRIF